MPKVSIEPSDWYSNPVISAMSKCEKMDYFNMLLYCASHEYISDGVELSMLSGDSELVLSLFEEDDSRWYSKLFVENKKRVARTIERPAWYTDFEEYKKQLYAAVDELLLNRAWIAEREQYHPYTDISASVEKAVNDFWGTEAGWKNKKDSGTKDINWTSTINKTLSYKTNQVPKKNAQFDKRKG